MRPRQDVHYQHTLSENPTREEFALMDQSAGTYEINGNHNTVLTEYAGAEQARYGGVLVEALNQDDANRIALQINRADMKTGNPETESTREAWEHERLERKKVASHKGILDKKEAAKIDASVNKSLEEAGITLEETEKEVHI